MPEQFAREAYPILSELLPDIHIVSLTPGQRYKAISTALEQADFLIWTGVEISEQLIAQGPQLKLIQKWGAGVDGIDVSAAGRRGVWVANVQGGNAIAVAEHFFALLLALYKRLCLADSAMRAGQWVQAQLMEQGIWELNGKSLGIVGLGQIGCAIATRAIPFGMQVFYYKRKPLDSEKEREMQVSFLAVTDLVRQVDIVGLAVPLTNETKGMFGMDLLQMMKPSSVLINVSRGAVLKEADLYRALTEGNIAGAGLDVFEPEPPSHENSLLQLPNVVSSPHIAGRTKEAMQFITKQCAMNVLLVSRGETPHHVITTGA